MSLMPLSSVGIWEMGIAPVADFADSTQYTDIFNVSNYKQTTFLIVKGVGTTGTSTITVQACDDVSASNTSAGSNLLRISKPAPAYMEAISTVPNPKIWVMGR